MRSIASDLLAADGFAASAVGVAWHGSYGTAPVDCDVSIANDPWHWLEQQATSYKFFWPIFPESWKYGPSFVGHAIKIGYKLCCSGPAALALASDKLACLRRLALHGLDVVPCWSVGQPPAEDIPGKWVRKPRHGTSGAGCRLFNSLAAAYNAAGCTDDLLQPYVIGDSCSLTMACSDRQAIVLAGNRQNIVFTATGSVLNFIMVNALSLSKVSHLGQNVFRAIPGLRGFIGIDFISTHDNRLVVIEVNPRVTSTYPGLRQALGVNPLRWLAPLFFAADMPALPKVSVEPTMVAVKAAAV